MYRGEHSTKTGKLIVTHLLISFEVMKYIEYTNDLCHLHE
jgi:hypothetical protein